LSCELFLTSPEALVVLIVIIVVDVVALEIDDIEERFEMARDKLTEKA
jgi:hypothetical protein